MFCVDCMRSHLSVRITEGQVNSLTCPEDKCEMQAQPDEVR